MLMRLFTCLIISLYLGWLAGFLAFAAFFLGLLAGAGAAASDILAQLNPNTV